MSLSLRVWPQLFFACALSYGAALSAHAAVPESPNLQQTFSKLPITFEENRGQVDSAVKFVARGPGYGLFLTAREAVAVYQDNRSEHAKSAAIHMRFEGANDVARIQGAEPLTFKTNYFGGKDPEQQITSVANYARVQYSAIYPGIDVVYYGNQQQLEYDLLVAPKSDPRQIQLRLFGADKVTLSQAGDLVLDTAAGQIVHHKPIAYQLIDGARQPVDVRYKLIKGSRLIAFDVGRYDTSKPLVIDPILSYASYLYGTNANGVALDSSGNIYVVGNTTNGGLPTVGGYQTTFTGNQAAYVIKIDPTGTRLIYATYLGAIRRATTAGNTIAVDASGNAIVTGTTDSSSYPVTTGAYQTSYTSGDSFITKLNATGSALVYSTFIHASITGLTLDSQGNAYLSGNSSTLKATTGAYQTSPKFSPSPIVAKLNAAGSAMVFATYLGGSSQDQANAIAIDSSGNSYVTGVTTSTNFPTLNPIQATLSGGKDVFVTKLNPTGTALVYSTYLGGTDNDTGNAIAVDSRGQAHITGMTSSANFPITQGVFQPVKGYADPAVTNAFITKLNAAGSAWVFSSYLGGAWCLTTGVSSCSGLLSDGIIDAGTTIAVDPTGYVYVGGVATSVTFPLADSLEPVGSGGDVYRTPFLAKIMPNGSQKIYSAVFGTRAQDEKLNSLAIDSSGNVFAVGYKYDSTVLFPITGGALVTSGSDFLVKLSPGKYPTRVSTNANPTTPSQSVTLTATAQSTRTGGTITFYDGTNSLGVVTPVDGTASLNISLAAGVHKITAVYSLDNVVSPPIFQIVNGM